MQDDYNRYKRNTTFTIIFDDSNQRNLWLNVQPDSNPYEITLKINMKTVFLYSKIISRKKLYLLVDETFLLYSNKKLILAKKQELLYKKNNLK